jgi:hypothetical protein
MMRCATDGSFKRSEKDINDVLIHVDASAPRPFVLIFRQIEDFRDILIPSISKRCGHPTWVQLPVP